MSKQFSIRTHIGFLTHRISGKAFPVSDRIATCLVKTIASYISLEGKVAESLLFSHRLVFNFRNKSHSAEGGGFRPVEICLLRSADGDWQYQYVTDFAYIGNHYPELEKALDFDFHNCGAYSCGIPMRNQQEANELYQLWEHNFLAYLEMDAYDDISITSA